MQQECRWYACWPADAFDTITLNRKGEVEHESGLSEQGLLNGAHDRDDALRGLRQTWPRRGDEYVATFVCGSTVPFRMFRGRDPREQF